MTNPTPRDSAQLPPTDEQPESAIKNAGLSMWKAYCNMKAENEELREQIEALRAQAASVVPVGEYLANVDEYGGVRLIGVRPPHGTNLYAGAPPAHIPADVEASEGAKFFSYDEDNGFEMHGTAEEAKNAATVRLALYRDDANIDNEWAYETDSVCWGCVLESAEAMPVLGAPEPSFDYRLTAHAPQPQAVAASSLCCDRKSERNEFCCGLPPTSPATAVDAVIDAIDWVDNFVARCNGDDRGSNDSVNLIRAALQASRQPQAQQAVAASKFGSPELQDMILQQAVAEGAVDVSKAVALYEAVSAIYFDDSSDFKPALMSAIRALSPEMEEMLRDDPRAAWQKADEAKDAALATKGQRS